MPDGPGLITKIMNMIPGGTSATMSSSTRGKFLLAGSVIAFIGFVIPGMYGVEYSPPSGSGYPPVYADQLLGFAGVYNGFNGPYNCREMLISIIIMFVLGLVVHVIDFNVAYRMLSGAQKLAHLVFDVSGLMAGVGSIAYFIWQFTGDRTPQAIRQTFIDRLGGGDKAVEASQHVTGTLGLATIIAFCGMLVALIGVLPKTFGIISGTLVVGIAVLLCAWPRADNSTVVITVQSEKCVLVNGYVDTCHSTDPSVEVRLVNSSDGTAGCRFTVTIDWGDKTRKQTVKVAGGMMGTIRLADHTYTKPGLYSLVVTGHATAGNCSRTPWTWEPMYGYPQARK